MLRRRRIGSHLVVERPLTRTLPSLGVRRALISLRVVVLPEPLRPSRTTVSPLFTTSDRFSSRGRPLRLKETRSNSMAGGLFVDASFVDALFTDALFAISLLELLVMELCGIFECGISAGSTGDIEKHEMGAAIARSAAWPDLVRALGQSGDAKATVAPVPDIEAD